MNDYIIIIFLTKEEYEQHVKKILKYLSKRNLLLKSKKYNWYKIEVHFLKFIIKRNNIRINFDKFVTILAQLNSSLFWLNLTSVKAYQDLASIIW